MTIEVALFRILQEALTNVETHAKATNVRVELTRSASQIQMTVQDNGRGFAPRAASDESSSENLVQAGHRSLDFFVHERRHEARPPCIVSEFRFPFGRGVQSHGPDRGGALSAPRMGTRFCRTLKLPVK